MLKIHPKNPTFVGKIQEKLKNIKKIRCAYIFLNAGTSMVPRVFRNVTALGDGYCEDESVGVSAIFFNTIFYDQFKLELLYHPTFPRFKRFENIGEARF